MSWYDGIYNWAVGVLRAEGLSPRTRTWEEVLAEYEGLERELSGLHHSLESVISSGQIVTDAERVLHDTSAMNVFATGATLARLMLDAGIPESEIPFPSMPPWLSPNPSGGGAMKGFHFGAIPFRQGQRIDLPSNMAAGFGWGVQVALGIGGLLIGVAATYAIMSSMAPNAASASVAASGVQLTLLRALHAENNARRAECRRGGTCEPALDPSDFEPAMTSTVPNTEKLVNPRNSNSSLSSLFGMGSPLFTLSVVGGALAFAYFALVKGKK